MVPAVGKEWLQNIFQLILITDFHGLSLLGKFVA
jgi:hypothetical protein